MDKKSLIGLGLIAVILVVWLSISGPSKEQIARTKFIKDSVALATSSAEKMATEKVLAVKQVSVTTAVPLTDSAKQVALSSVYQDFTASSIGKEETVTIENEFIKAYISTKGGAVKKVELKNYKRYGQTVPLILFDKDSTYQNLQFNAFTTNTKIVTDSLYFVASAPAISVAGNESKTLTLKLATNKPESYIEYSYSLKGNDYLLGYNIGFVGMQNIISAKNKAVTLNWKQALPSQEQHISKEREGATVYYNLVKDGVDYINPRKMDSVLFNEFDVKWVSFKQQFFNTTLIADKEFLKENSLVKTSENKESKVFVKNIYANLSIPYNHSANEVFGMKYYFGPTHYNTLKTYDLDLEKMIPTGFSVFSYINKWMVIPLFNAFGGMNMGIVILILTLILKTFLFPIAYKSYMSSSKMRVLKPEVDEINAKYEKLDDPMKKQSESMALYKRAGANPLSGCLPVLLQMPILIALFAFIPAAIELRGKPFLWADDLSTYDSVYNFGFEVWGYGDHISLFAMLMFVSTLIYTWLNQALLQPQQTNQMPGMKYMMYLMPVIFLAVMNSYAAGLSWYYFLANVITFLQTWLMKKFIDDGKIRNQLLENMKKPVKKSAFQTRLEEMSKQRQIPAKK